MATIHKLDIFAVLSAADRKDVEFYRNIPADQKNGFIPIVATRWMSGTFDAAQVFLLNEFVNPYIFSLYKHPQLLWMLLVACNSGKTRRYTWNKTQSSSTTNKPNTIKLIQEYFNYTKKQASDSIELFDRVDLLEIAEELGWQPDEIAKIKKENKSAKSTVDSQLDDVLQF